MTDRGLNFRLRQRSRRAGLMIGISMAITIALCVGGFSVIYSALDQYTTDFVSGEEPTVQPTTAQVAADAANPTQPASEAGGGNGDGNGNGNDTGEQAQETPAPTSGDSQVTPTPTQPAEFTPDYQIGASQTINLRSGPGVRFDRVTSLTPEQPLMYLDESQPTEDPQADQIGEGDLWMKFRTEDGEEGWVREIDVEEFDPNA